MPFDRLFTKFSIISLLNSTQMCPIHTKKNFCIRKLSHSTKAHQLVVYILFTLNLFWISFVLSISNFQNFSWINFFKISFFFCFENYSFLSKLSHNPLDYLLDSVQKSQLFVHQIHAPSSKSTSSRLQHIKSSFIRILNFIFIFQPCCVRRLFTFLISLKYFFLCAEKLQFIIQQLRRRR